ncbi:hypothetical protein Y032_0460g1860 [Ancylostoma ceylanicum]|uniref:Uncharacterized protein n=1 Tax=Ancylostoma ceylanicum TaxID=53326 RepID=A0A016WXE1_9BILA|nr:hypothetical protein Y032_0460g1860 [Ancylostoma ceylanicum]
MAQLATMVTLDRQHQRQSSIAVPGPMADSIVRQLYPEFKKVAESSAKVANDLVQSVENHEKELHAKFEKYLEGRSRSTSLDVARLELEREQRCHAEAESEIVCAEQSVVKAEKREQVRVDKLKSSATALQKSGIDVAKEQSMREMYQDMIDKLAEMKSTVGVNGGDPSAASKITRRKRAARARTLSLTSTYGGFLDSQLVFLLVIIKCDEKLPRELRYATAATILV